MELMEETPDGYYDLAVVDPPYGSSNIHGGYCKGAFWKLGSPGKVYFDELMRVSKNQIIWGANHFIESMPMNSSSWIVCDKRNEKTKYADCELAWSSHDRAVRKFEFMWNGMLQGDMKNKEFRIHPTQKPVKLYDWIFANYAEKGMKVLDTHMGSGSIAIAAHHAGIHLTATELDEHYFNAAIERNTRETSQATLF